MDFEELEIVRKLDDSIVYYGYIPPPETQRHEETISNGLEFNPHPPPNESILQFLPPSKISKKHAKTTSFRDHLFSPAPVYKGVQFTTLGGKSFQKYPQALDDSSVGAGFVVHISSLKKLLSGTRDLYCSLSNGDMMAIGTLRLDDPALVVETTVLGRDWEEVEPAVGRFLVSDVLRRVHNGHISKGYPYFNYPQETGSLILSPIPTQEEIKVLFKCSPQAGVLMEAAMEENNSGEALFRERKYNEGLMCFQRASVFGYFACPANRYCKVLYNLAYCYYALGIFLPAEKWIGVSLQLERSPMSEQLHAAILNAQRR
eukprot:TRINITY_DN14803_c0_g1_i1.p1 TRINITY_DN14803_c0_g1~~TRINITY_DN14803_c0_g1_i1.p1  ORF type:complete len:316 (+),score=45.37 TRINITY_DN14803_c0_g1_i1:100-1047(+)